MAAMFVYGSKLNEQSLQSILYRCFLSSLGSFGKAVSEEKIFRNRPIRNKTCLWRPCFLIDRDDMRNLYKGPSIYASYQASVHLAKTVSEEKNFKNQPIRNKNCLWRPCLLLYRNEMSNRYREPPIDDTYKVLVNLAKRFQRRRFFRNKQIRNKKCLWRPCLLTDQNKMSNLYTGPSIDASQQVSVHLAKRFQKRTFKKINQSETRIACGGHVCQRIGTK